MSLTLFSWGWILGLTVLWPSPAWTRDLPLENLSLPAGFQIEVLAMVPGARSLCWGDGGTLFVGTRGDKVFAVTEAGRGRAGEVRVVASGLREPNGVAFRDGSLYVAAVDRVLRYPDVESRLDAPPPGEVVSDELPGEGHHGWRYASFGPDGRLYIGVGAPCNVCRRPPPYATIIRMDRQGRYEVFARGVRNTVGFDWRPSTGVLWFTNNGRDWMGDDQPPDSLHRAPAAGLDFGFPLCHAGVPDPELNRGGDCDRFARPSLELPAHVAPLGMRFYAGGMFPPEYRGAIFMAEHGSWNRSRPIGYRVSLALLEGERVVGYRIFASGWLQGSRAWGRPVDLVVDQEGALLVSDDRAGAIYRITHRSP